MTPSHVRPVVYTGARVFTADPAQPWAQAVVVGADGRIAFVGDEAEARAAAGTDAEVRDVASLDFAGGAPGRLIAPGFVDAHVHILLTGYAELQAHLTDATGLDEIQQRLLAWAAANPDEPRVMGQGWLFSQVPGGRPTRQMLDAVIADRPVYLDCNDYHFAWVNTAALAELGITDQTPDPEGGRIARDEHGVATGLLEETASFGIVWPYLASVRSAADHDRALAAAIAAYNAAGVTTAVDMMLDEPGLAALVRARDAGTLDLRMTGHWMIERPGTPEEHLAGVARAAELARLHDGDRFRVVGIKIAVDGTIDGCTAALLRPYANGADPAPIWEYEALAPVVAAADAAGLQIALHAIGDRAIRVALDVLEHAVAVNGPRPRRHRIEHLEYTDPVEIGRLAALGVTASMQPVHADPAIMPNWVAQLGDHRADRGFAWPEMRDAGAVLAFGTDAPTAPYPPLRNLYVATTRLSAITAGTPAFLPHYALPMEEAWTHATRDAAWAAGLESVAGSLRVGAPADLVVLSADPFVDGPASLLEARVLATLVSGRGVAGAWT